MLSERYARVKITEDEYRQRLGALREQQTWARATAERAVPGPADWLRGRKAQRRDSVVSPVRHEVPVGHMGGPFRAKRDAGGRSVPKGEYDPDEEPEAAARREFAEELGVPAPSGEFRPLGIVRQAGGKVVTLWAVEGDLDPTSVVPGTFEMEWPKGSGRLREFPEIDRVEWFELARARGKVVVKQRDFLDRLAGLLGSPGERARRHPGRAVRDG